LTSSDWVHLRLLDISSNNIGNKGMSFLAKSDWPKLEMLTIRCCSITVDGLKQIAHTQWSTKMKVDIGMYNAFTDYYFRNCLDDTGIFSVKVLSKQYSPRDLLAPENQFGYTSWGLRT
jgi:hypothetical protein